MMASTPQARRGANWHRVNKLTPTKQAKIQKQNKHQKKQKLFEKNERACLHSGVMYCCYLPN
jgi:hypothetical protein